MLKGNPVAGTDGLSIGVNEAMKAKKSLKEAERHLRSDDWSCDLLNFTKITDDDWDQKLFSTKASSPSMAVPHTQKNSSCPQFQPGDRIRVFGSRSHTAYNGMHGTVLAYVASEARYHVRLDTNDVCAIKRRNVGHPLSDFSSAKGFSSAFEFGKKNLDNDIAKKTEDTVLSDIMKKLMQDSSYDLLSFRSMCDDWDAKLFSTNASSPVKKRVTYMNESNYGIVKFKSDTDLLDKTLENCLCVIM